MLFIPTIGRPVDPRETLKTLPVGSLLPYLWRESYSSPKEVVFGIREESKRLPFIKMTPIDVRIGILEETSVYLIPVVVRLQYHGFPTEYFECWFNIDPCNDFSAECYQLIKYQPRLIFSFFGDSGEIERGLGVLNDLSFWRKVASVIDPSHTWTNEAFESARARIYDRFPSPRELFYFLGQQYYSNQGEIIIQDK